MFVSLLKTTPSLLAKFGKSRQNSEIEEKLVNRVDERRNMPVVSDELAKVSLATLIPGIGSAVSYAVFLSDKEAAVNWWNSLKKPSWAPKDWRLYAAVDMATALPLGCASYLVYKHGDGFHHTDTTAALVAYGAHMGLCWITVPIMLKKKDVQLSLAVAVVLSGTGALTAGLFYNIFPKAGLMVAPWVLWSGFYSCLLYHIWKTGPKNPSH